MILSLYLDEDAQRTAFVTALRQSKFDVVTQLQGIQNLATLFTAETLANQLLFLSNYL
jgi:hypothetical protein